MESECGHVTFSQNQNSGVGCSLHALQISHRNRKRNTCGVTDRAHNSLYPRPVESTLKNKKRISHKALWRVVVNVYDLFWPIRQPPDRRIQQNT